MDELDQEILMQLKEDSRRTVTEISKAIGRSHSATRVRVNNLMKSGIISRFTIELANYRDELLPKGYVDVVLPNGAKAERIASALEDIEEVCDIALVTGKFTCQVLIQCEATAKMKELADVIQERLGSSESRVRIITGSIPGYPRSNNPIYLSHLLEESQSDTTERSKELVKMYLLLKILRGLHQKQGRTIRIYLKLFLSPAWRMPQQKTAKLMTKMMTT